MKKYLLTLVLCLLLVPSLFAQFDSFGGFDGFPGFTLPGIDQGQQNDADGKDNKGSGKKLSLSLSYGMNYSTGFGFPAHYVSVSTAIKRFNLGLCAMLLYHKYDYYSYDIGGRTETYEDGLGVYLKTGYNMLNKGRLALNGNILTGFSYYDSGKDRYSEGILLGVEIEAKIRILKQLGLNASAAFGSNGLMLNTALAFNL